MRFAFLTELYFPSVGGAQLHWLTIGRLLRARGHEVSAISQWKDQGATTYTADVPRTLGSPPIPVKG